MDVTDVLRDRMSEQGGLERAAAMSLVAHGVLVATMLFAPGAWWTRSTEMPHPVMTITLGGGVAGPQAGGLTQEGGKPVQAVRPPEEENRPEPARAPAAKTPDMTLPEKNARPSKTPPPTVKEAPADARGRTPTRGAETREGTAAAETGVRGLGFGLSTGGGAGSGSYLDVADFCCPEYIATMADRIRRNWTPGAGSSGEVIIKFTIQRDGRITDTTTEQSSGNAILDLTAQRAVSVTRQLPPLPAAFPNPTLTVHLNFQYQR